ncbi:MAG TPA: hypothetical protein VF532_17625 [Candidatus Angelobacter sp.]
MQSMLNSSPRVTQLKRFQQMANRGPHAQRLAQWQMRMNRASSNSSAAAHPIQRECGEEMEGGLGAEFFLQGMFPMQRMCSACQQEEETLQGQFLPAPAADVEADGLLQGKAAWRKGGKGRLNLLPSQHTLAPIQRVATVRTLIGRNPPADDDPVPVGRLFENKDEGIAILERLGRGDRTVFEDLGLEVPEGYKMQAHEWGLGYDGDTERYVIIRGGPGAVNFGKGVLRNVVGISHTHPLPTGSLSQDVEGMSFLEMVQTAGMVGVDAVFTGYNSVFPSNTDIISNYTIGSKNPEMLFTPYRLDAHGNFSDNPRDPLVSVSFGPAMATLRKELPVQATENGAIDFLYAPMTIFRGDENIWNGTLQVSTDSSSAAWPKKIAIPDNAHHRDQNGRTIDDHNRRYLPELLPPARTEPMRATLHPSREHAQEMESVRMEEQPQKKKKKKKKKGCFSCW